MLKLGWLLLVFSAQASDMTGKIQHLAIDYTHPAGSASTQFLEFDQYHFPSTTSYDVDIQAGSLILQTPTETISFDNLPNIVVDVERFFLDQFNLTSDAQKVHLSLKYLKSVTPKDTIQLYQFRIDCKKELISDSYQRNLLHGCLNKSMDLRVGNYKVDGTSKLSQLKFRSINHHLNYEIKIAGVSIKGKGKTYFQQDKIRLKIDTAKVGPVNVKKKLFSELKKMQSPTVRVNSPWVEIDLR
jgi:hypothetical protein